MRISALILLFSLSFGRTQLIKATAEKHTQQQVFVPDTTINSKLKLDDCISVEKHIGDIMDGTDGNASLPDIYFKNASGTQYLRLIFFPGSTRNAFQRFEIGINISPKKVARLKNFTSFKTESGISIGSSLNSVIAKKGKNYRRENINGAVVITYHLTGLDTHPFLKAHNNPLYSAEYYFKKGNCTSSFTGLNILKYM